MYGDKHTMIRSTFILGGVLWLHTCALPAAAESPADRFVQNLDSMAAIPVDAREMIRKTWSDCIDCDGEEFLTQGLTVISKKFRDGLDAYDSDDYAKCAILMRASRKDANPFVAAHATAYEIKTHVQMEKLLEALTLMEDLKEEDRTAIARYSYFDAEIDFLYGFCLLSDLQFEEASMSLGQFLEKHGDASQRLVIAAQQMLIELANRAGEDVGEVVDLMNFSSRRLKHADTGEIVRTRQQRILDLLDQMIEEAEQQEQQQQSGSGGSSGGSSGKSPSTPMQDSTLPGGSSAEGPLRGAAKKANPAQTWGSMPAAQRQKILQAIRESFPSRYRKLVEQYYEELGKKP